MADFAQTGAIVALLMTVQLLSTCAYTTTPGLFATTLDCSWYCLAGSLTGSCFCVANMNTTALWTDAQALCTSDGGYLAKILTADKQMLMEDLVDLYGWNYYGSISSAHSKTVYIGLQRNYYYVSNTAQDIYWRDQCLEPMTENPIVAEIADNYTSKFFPNVGAIPKFPFGAYMESFNDMVFWYATNPTYGPWQDWNIDENYGTLMGPYVGAYCRKDLNACGSNPCKNGGICVPNKSCFNCTCEPEYTGRQCEYTLVPSTLLCDWACVNDSVRSCICVIRNDSSNLFWSDAKAICEADGAYLARIDTQVVVILVWQRKFALPISHVSIAYQLQQPQQLQPLPRL